MRRWWLLALLALPPACGGSDSDSGDDGDSDAGGDDAGGPPGPPRAGTCAGDAGEDLPPVQVVPGARCAPVARVGVVEITAERMVRAELHDRTDPWVTKPAASDPACELHRFVIRQCDSCGDDEICGLDGRCAAIPCRDPAARLVLRAGDAEQVLDANPNTGEIHGAITLAGDLLRIEAEAFGQQITMDAELGVPDLLDGFSASLLGTSELPEGIEASWDAAPGDTHLFTRIPINHHGGGPTFTECAVSAAAGSLRIGQEVLEPLAVATGLEFQSFEHIQFAAADTARGCVEARFTRQQSAGLEGI